MKTIIANKVWRRTSRELADNLEIECCDAVSSVCRAGSAVVIWNQVRSVIKSTKDILEGELYDKNTGR